MNQWRGIVPRALDRFRHALPEDCVREASNSVVGTKYEWRSPIEGIETQDLLDLWLRTDQEPPPGENITGYWTWDLIAELLQSPIEELQGRLALLRLR